MFARIKELLTDKEAFAAWSAKIQWKRLGLRFVLLLLPVANYLNWIPSNELTTILGLLGIPIAGVIPAGDRNVVAPAEIAAALPPIDEQLSALPPPRLASIMRLLTEAHYKSAPKP